MKLTLRHSFSIGADAFWRDVFFDHAFLERLYKEGLGCVGVSFLEDTGDVPEGRRRRLTFTQPFDAPGPIRKLFGDTTTMEERGQLDPQSKRWRYAMVPDRMSDKIRITGETWVVPAGEGAIERVSEVDLSVNIFGVGSLVEKFMASETSQSFERQATFIREHIRNGRPS